MKVQSNISVYVLVMFIFKIDPQNNTYVNATNDHSLYLFLFELNSKRNLCELIYLKNII
jgi:hypothetical protein